MLTRFDADAPAADLTDENGRAALPLRFPKTKESPAQLFRYPGVAQRLAIRASLAKQKERD